MGRVGPRAGRGRGRGCHGMTAPGTALLDGLDGLHGFAVQPGDR
ncbi:hypothetical protein ACFPM3_17895 [Streptomyces coeruleoprunus]|uniref:Uncharacterized protein n=1 Tax=Streptomyces coeruleoprunus TaxID=285563 RepID=A0ABV9XKC6_9ACTN